MLYEVITNVRVGSEGFAHAPFGKPYMSLFPLETIQPHAASTPTATQTVGALMRHFHQFHTGDALQQFARFIVNAVGASEIARVMIGNFGLYFVLEKSYNFV